ncbi:hypothetical protein CRYUN_Cryun07bG0140500 [Craigia yunnanensis]
MRVCTSSYSEYNFMDDGLGKIKVIPDHFQVSTPSGDSPQNRSSPDSQPRIDNSLRIGPVASRRKLRSAAVMLNLFSLHGLPWSFGADGQEKVQLTAADLESLRSELADNWKLCGVLLYVNAQLANNGWNILMKFCGLLVFQTICTSEPGGQFYLENQLRLMIPILTTVFLDSLFSRANVYSSIYSPQLYYTDLGPQDSTLLSDVVEVGSLPSFMRGDEGMQYSFYILTCLGLRYECSHVSKIQSCAVLNSLNVLAPISCCFVKWTPGYRLYRDCKAGSDVKVPNGSSESKIICRFF